MASATPAAAIPGTINRLQSVDPRGRRAPLWSFGEHTGCGGGTSDPSEQLEWEETGFGSLALTFTWFAKHHLAVYTNSLCVGSVLVTDTRTGRTGPLGRHPHAWHEGVLSPDGTVVAAMITSPPERTIVLHMRDSFGNATDSQTYTTTIWRSRADGSGLQRIHDCPLCPRIQGMRHSRATDDFTHF